MLTNVSHQEGITIVEEILFNTPFGYMFPHTQDSPECYLRESTGSLKALWDLGRAMADPGEIGDPTPALDSDTPAIYTYFGQFIDHDITARTDRDTGVSDITPDSDDPITPLSHEIVVAKLLNGRRPQLDLDSVYGDGPGLIEFTDIHGNQCFTETEASALYVDPLDNPAAKFALRLNRAPGYVDVPRQAPTKHGTRALIADMRNDENVQVSQLHSAMIAFHNEIYNALAGDDCARYARARQLARWAYQYVVLNDYLPRVCDPCIVADTLANGPRFFSPAASGAALFMPLEFSVAGFRFGHSMIRPFYELNSTSGEIPINQLLEAGAEHNQDNGQLRADLVVDWDFFAEGGSDVQMARKIDPKIAQGLMALPFGNCDPILANLSRRNLLRAYLLKIPTGQACASAMGIVPLKAVDLLHGETEDMKEAMCNGRLTDRTPLWYYVLKEASVHTDGQSLGAVGSRIVAETLIGLVKQDVNSYLNNCCDPAVMLDGIQVKPGAAGKKRKERSAPARTIETHDGIGSDRPHGGRSEDSITESQESSGCGLRRHIT